MSLVSGRRPFAALALLAMATAVFAAPASSIPVIPVTSILDGLAPRWSANKDYTTSGGAAVAPFSKRAGGGPFWPLRLSDCVVDDSDAFESYNIYEYNEQNYDEDCLLILALSIEVEQRGICRISDGPGYDFACLLDLVVKTEIAIDIEEEERMHHEDMSRLYPSHRSDCNVDSLGDSDFLFWILGLEGEKYEDDCLFKLYLLLDTDTKKACKMGEVLPGYEAICMLEFTISHDIDALLDSLTHGTAAIDDAVDTLIKDLGDIIKRDGGPQWPSRSFDCTLPEFWRHGDRFYFNDDGDRFEDDCLLALALLLDAEKKESCMRAGYYEEECLFKLIISLELDIEV